MYSSLSSATHHIFFPPRLEVVVEEQNSDGFPSHSRDQTPLDRFFCHQPHGPAGAAFGWITADHGDDALPLAVLQNLGCSRPLLIVKSPVEARVLVAAPDLSHCFGS